MFAIRYQGKVILEIDEQVTGVRVQTSRGESSVTGVAPNEGVIDLIIDKVAPGGPPRLDQIEEAQRQALRDRAEEGVVVGFTRDEGMEPAGMKQGQNIGDETLRKGDVDRRPFEDVSGPTVDLAAGLAPGDTDTLTARLEAFGNHHDAKRAIEDNQPERAQKRETPSAPSTNAAPNDLGSGSSVPPTSGPSKESDPEPGAKSGETTTSTTPHSTRTDQQPDSDPDATLGDDDSPKRKPPSIDVKAKPKN